MFEYTMEANVYVDSWEKGEVDYCDSWEYSEEYKDISWDNIEKFINRLGFSFNSKHCEVEEDKIYIKYTTNADHKEATEEELENWKNGKDLFATTMTIKFKETGFSNNVKMELLK